MAMPGSIINVVFGKIVIDLDLGLFTNRSCTELSSCAAVIALAVSAVSYFAAVQFGILVMLYFIQTFYPQISRQLRLLE